MKKANTFIAFLPIILLIAFIFCNVYTFGDSALEGPCQISLIAISAICTAIGMLCYHIPWKDFENEFAKKIKEISTAILILLIIGALSSIWMISGIVPTLIYYGLEIIHPRFFFATTCIICALVSVVTGSSWTTIATIGIALLGIGKALGFSDAMTAGAIISGAYFGDKVSPLSDTTVFASSTVGTPLFDHIRYLMITTTPAFILTLIIFTCIGLTGTPTDSFHIHLFSEALATRFHISPWLLLVPLATGLLIARKIPSAITLFLSTLLAVVFAIIFQSDALAAIGEGNLFKGIITCLYGSTSLETPSDLLTNLIATRGMNGMINTVWLILCAMFFGGALTASGMLDTITHTITGFIRNRFSMVSSTLLTGFFMNLTTSDQYLSILITGNIFLPIYQKFGYEKRLLSRSIEDSATVTSPLIPWNSCGITQATVLSVPTITYLPYCFFNYISPLISMLIAAIGYKIYRRGISRSRSLEC